MTEHKSPGPQVIFSCDLPKARMQSGKRMGQEGEKSHAGDTPCAGGYSALANSAHHSWAPRPHRSLGLGEGSGGSSQGPRYLAAFSLDFRFLLCVTWMTSKVSLHKLSTARRRLIRRSCRLHVHTPVSHTGLCTAAHCGTSRRPECQLWKSAHC